MKRTILFLSILLVASSIYAQKVFKQYGVDKEPMTLSKGRYVETFPNEETWKSKGGNYESVAVKAEIQAIKETPMSKPLPVKLAIPQPTFNFEIKLP